MSQLIYLTTATGLNQLKIILTSKSISSYVTVIRNKRKIIYYYNTPRLHKIEPFIDSNMEK